jgi:hypothetical protein
MSHVESVISKALPRGFAVDHGTFVGPTNVIEEAKDEHVTLSRCDVQAVYRSCGPAKALSTPPRESSDEKHTESGSLSRGSALRTPDFSQAKSLGDSPLSVSSCSVVSGSPGEDASDRPRPALIVIDNDECIGSWGTLLFPSVGVVFGCCGYIIASSSGS